MTNIDGPLPTDRKPGHIALLAICGQLAFFAVAFRHEFLYGGAWHGSLNILEGIGLVAATMLGGGALALAVGRANSVPMAYLAGIGILLTAIATAAPPFLSDDIWDYLARGRVAVLGQNPYTDTVASLARNPEMSEFAGLAKWDHWVMPYGPFAALLQHLVATIDAPWLGAYTFKGLMAIAHVLTAWLVLLTLRSVAGERDARRGYVLWLWNPWLLLESCGQGHNDALVALGLATAGLMIARSRTAMATFAYGCAMLVKHCNPAFLPALFGDALRQRAIPAFAIGSAFIVAILTLSQWHWWSGPGGLDWITNQDNVARGSLPALLGRTLGEWAIPTTRIIGAFATLWILRCAYGAGRNSSQTGRVAILATVTFTMCCVMNFAPWYHLWWLPLFALGNLPVLTRLVELMAWLGPLSYLVYVSTHGYGWFHEAWALAVAGIWPALLLLLDRGSLLGTPKQGAG